MKNYNSKDVSAAICIRNSVEILEDTIKSLRMNNVKEIVVIDGNSTDGTFELAKRLADKVVRDSGLGLASARNMAIPNTTGKCILFIGPGNIIEEDFVEKLLDKMNETGWSLTGCLTRVRNRQTYWDYGMDYLWKTRITPGEKDIRYEAVGSPYIIPHEIQKKYPYDPRVQYKDDVVLLETLSKNGLRFGRSDTVCREMENITFKEIKIRYRMYGLSDHQYYKQFSKDWSISRKIKSLIHPIKVDFIKPLFKMRRIKDVVIIPFLLIIITIRTTRYWYLTIKEIIDRTNQSHPPHIARK
jgi:glycosyltransferase involved in cell wall biosynthesis